MMFDIFKVLFDVFSLEFGSQTFGCGHESTMVRRWDSGMSLSKDDTILLRSGEGQ